MMIKDYQHSHEVEQILYRREFFVDEHGGCSFPCDENGVVDVDSLAPEGKKNYEHALAHPELYPYKFNKFEKIVTSYREPASGVCHCGERVYFEGRGYMGGFECPNCGRWYNAFGQELLPPNQWEEDY